MTQYFKSVLELDTSPIVLCDCDHKILYMNPAAVTRYARAGGEKLIGRSVLDCHAPAGKARIQQVLNWFAESTDHNRVHTMYVEKENLDVYMIALRDEKGNLIGYYEKQASRNRDMTPLYDC